MNDQEVIDAPTVIDSILNDTRAAGFTMASEPQTGSLLRALAASKPKGNFLELGTGTGVGTAWLLAGMDPESRLVTVDIDAATARIAQRHLGHDTRVTFHIMDGADFLQSATPNQFDLIYADAWPGKFSHLEAALSLLRVGGFYCVDDLLPQVSWPDGHAPRVPALIADLTRRAGFVSVRLAWSSGLLLLVRTKN